MSNTSALPFFAQPVVIFWISSLLALLSSYLQSFRRVLWKIPKFAGHSYKVHFVFGKPLYLSKHSVQFKFINFAVCKSAPVTKCTFVRQPESVSNVISIIPLDALPLVHQTHRPNRDLAVSYLWILSALTIFSICLLSK